MQILSYICVFIFVGVMSLPTTTSQSYTDRLALGLGQAKTEYGELRQRLLSECDCPRGTVCRVEHGLRRCVVQDGSFLDGALVGNDVSGVRKPSEFSSPRFVESVSGGNGDHRHRLLTSHTGSGGVRRLSVGPQSVAVVEPIDRGVGSSHGLLGGVVGDNLLRSGIMDFSTYGQRHYGIDYDQRHLGSSSDNNRARDVTSSDFLRNTGRQQLAPSHLLSDTRHLVQGQSGTSVSLRGDSGPRSRSLSDFIASTNRQNFIGMMPPLSGNTVSNCAYYDIPHECARSYNDVSVVYKYSYSAFTGKCQLVGVCQSCVGVAGLRFNLFDSMYSCQQSCSVGTGM